MKKYLLLIATLFICTVGYSQLYIGAGFGNSFYNQDIGELTGDDFKLNENALGWKVYGGYRMGFIGIEGGYRDLGSVSDENGGNLWETKLTSWDFAATGKLDIGPLYAQAKAGAAFYKSTVTVANLSDSENTTSFLWGVGAGVTLGKLGLGLSYESIDMSSSSSFSQLMLEATFSFGG
ncbi:MAG: hypothetical protein SchgKO_09810 [Schleiferiaceae bacterium]